MDFSSPTATGIGVVAGLVLLGYAAFTVVAFAQVWRSRTVGEWARIVWFGAIICVPLIGSLAWYLVGSQTSRAERAIAAVRR